MAPCPFTCEGARSVQIPHFVFQKRVNSGPRDGMVSDERKLKGGLHYA